MKSKKKMKMITKKLKLQGRGVTPAKRSIQVKGKWKSIEIDPSVFSEEGLEGLVCFEELTSYRLVDSDKAAVKAEKELEERRKKRREKILAKKRKASDMETGEVVEASEAAGEGTEIPKKKVKNKKKKVKAAEMGAQVEQKEDVKVDSQAGSGEDARNGLTEDVKSDNNKDAQNELTEDTQTGSTNDAQTGANKEANASKPAKKKKKKKTQKPKPELPTAEEKPVQKSGGELREAPRGKITQPKRPKEQVKNWTSAALSGCDDTSRDMSAWKDLFVPAPVLRALSSLGFTSPTPIQALALPSAIRDRMDVLGAAETGSGKTLAFAIPMIHMILEWRENHENPDIKKKGEVKKVESLYLPDAEPTETNEETENGQIEEMEEEEKESADVDELSKDDLKDGDGDDDDSNGSDDEDGAKDIKLGCVQVGEKATFDPAPQAQSREDENQPLLGLVVTPTRELAVQVKHHIDAVAKFSNVYTAIVVGGMSEHKQRRILKRRPQIVIGTPGRLWDLMKERDSHLYNLKHLRCLVIDEADRMVERGHFAELENLLEMLKTTHFNPKRQMFIFSATLTMTHALPARFQQKKKRLDPRSKLEILMEKVGVTAKPKVIDLSRKEATVETLTETQIHCQKEDKEYYLYYFLLQHPGRTMVFANSIDCIKRLKSILTVLGVTSFSLHANMQQKQRLKNLERFADRESIVLLTTDVAARGLDIPDVEHVIHYQVPRTSETYVHRSGRTARASKEGLCLLLVSPEDILNFRKIFKTLGKDEDLPMFPIERRYMEAIRERVDLARKIENIEYHNSKEKKHDSWFKRAAEALEVDLDEDMLLGKWRDEHSDLQEKKTVKGMKRQLKHLIDQPVFKSAMRTRYPTEMGTLALKGITLAGAQSALSQVLIAKEKQKAKRALCVSQNKKKRKLKRERKKKRKEGEEK